jgi:hypothetical protein
MWRKTLRRVDARWLLAGFAAVLIAGVWGLTLLQLREVSRQQEDDALHDAVGLVRWFDEQASRTLDMADQAAIFLRRRYQALGGRFDLNEELRNGLGSNQRYNLFTIVDAGAVFAAMRHNGRGTLVHAGPIDGRVRTYAHARLVGLTGERVWSAPAGADRAAEAVL